MFINYLSNVLYYHSLLIAPPCLKNTYACKLRGKNFGVLLNFLLENKLPN